MEQTLVKTNIRGLRGFPHNSCEHLRLLSGSSSAPGPILTSAGGGDYATDTYRPSHNFCFHVSGFGSLFHVAFVVAIILA